MDSDLRVGATLDGRYLLMDELGRGGMGIVFKARQESLDRTVAIKVISEPATKESVVYARFQREAKVSSSLSHPNIVTVYDFGITKQQYPYLVMEFIEGPSLGQIIARCSPIAVYHVIVWMISVCDALSYAHAKGIVHRDLKPDNIMLALDDTGREVIKVVDFGLARIFDDTKPTDHTLTAQNSILGTPAFMSPEQCLGKVLDPRSDIYSLGCVLYCALTARVPFKTATLQEMLVMQVTADAPPLAEVAPNQEFPAELQQFLSQAMRKDPKERQQSCDEMRIQLINILQALPTGSDLDQPNNTRSIAMQIGASRQEFSSTVGAKALAADRNEGKQSTMLSQIPDWVQGVASTPDSLAEDRQLPAAEPVAAENLDDYELSYKKGMQLRYGENPDFDKALDLFIHASDNQHQLACLERARLLVVFGEGTPVDLPYALQWFCYAYRMGCTALIEELLRCVNLLIESPIDIPEFLLVYLKNESSPRTMDPRTQKDVPSNAAAMIAYGKILESPDNPKGQNLAEALILYRRAAKLGASEGLYAAGRLLFLKNLEEKDFALLGASLASCDKGLAGLYASTSDSKRNEELKEGLRLLQESSDEGCTLAQLFLASLYYRGIGVKADNNKVAALLTRAAELEDIKAQAILGACLCAGIALEMDPAAGCNWLRESAASGDPFAQWNLAICLIDGTGTEANRPQAKTMLEAAAKKQFEQYHNWCQGAFAARFGRLLALFEQLSQQGQREAQYWLGVCYEYGVGLDRNRDLSLEQYCLASEQGYAPAKLAFDKAPEKMRSLVKRKMAKSTEGASKS